MATVNGFEYASGPAEIRNYQPNSNFSRGDVLMLAGGSGGDSNVSRANVLFASDVTIVGVAMSSSTESYRDNVPVVLALPSTVFRTSLESTLTALGSPVTVGFKYDIGLNTAGEMSLRSSTNSVRLVVVDLDEIADIRSSKSCVLVRFLSAGGETAQA